MTVEDVGIVAGLTAASSSRQSVAPHEFLKSEINTRKYGNCLDLVFVLLVGS